MDLGALLVAAGFIVFWIVVLAAGARGMLGLRVGRVRLLVSGIAGLVVALLALGRQADDADQPAYVALFVGVGVLVAMCLLVVLEIVASLGGRPRPLHWYRSTRQWLRRTRRYWQISRIAIRHGLGMYLSGRRDPTADRRRAGLARQLRLALEEGGVTFVKLGQILATRPDLLPQEFIDELSHLHSQVAPVPWPQIEAVLVEELGAPVGEVFAEIDREPLAAASIAQVHRARLRSGGQVVVKVQRPGIKPIVNSDLDITLRRAGMLHRRAGWARSVGIVDLAEGFAEALREELDFTVEARNMASLAAAHQDEQVVLPAAQVDKCTTRVLVMQFLDGIPIVEAGPVIDALGLQRTDLARTLLRTLLTQIMQGGVFHADPHPGNLLLLRDGRPAMLDFGSVGRLDARLRAVLQRILVGVERGDATALGDALLEVVEHPEVIDEVGLERAIGRFMARHLGPGQPPDMRMFTDLFRLVTHFGITIPAELAAVFRGLATLEGTLAQLAPGFDIVAEARAFAGSALVPAVDAESLRSAVTAEAVTLLPLLRRLPRRVDKLVSALEHGRFSVNVRLFADERDRHLVTELVHQTLVTLLAATTGIVGVILLGTAGGPTVAPDLSLYQLIGYGALLVSAALILRILTAVLRPR